MSRNSIRVKKSHNAHRVIAILALALLIRLFPHGRYVTPDEPIWVLRSVRLLDAVSTGHWASIPQTGHPGFSTMVIGALGVQLTKMLRPVVSNEHLTFIREIAWLAPESSTAFPHLAFFLPSCRILITITCALGIALVYVIGKKRFGERASRILALFLALDPFFAGHAGLLHTDALQATFLILSVLYIFPVLSGQDNKRIDILTVAASAAFLALAGLTKTLGLLVAPGLALVILLWGKGSFWQRCLRAFTLALLSVLFMLVLFPPFWMDPADALMRLVEAVTYHQGIGLRNVYFAGQMRVDPGPLFYPVVLLFRLTAPVFVGLLLGLWRRNKAQHSISGWFLVPIISYILGLTFAAKKFDRYILSVVPLLTVISAIQWRSLYYRYKSLILTVLCLPWALVAIFPLYHANILLGGPWLAQNIIPFGWGEGSGFAAQKLNDIYHDPSEFTVLTGDVPGVASIFRGHVLSKNESYALCADALIAQTARDFPRYQAIEDIDIAGIRIMSAFTQIFPFPEGHVLVPGVFAGTRSRGIPIPPKTNTRELQKWLNERFQGSPFTWIHAGECDPITESQLTTLLCPPDNADVPCHCTSSGTIEGIRLDQCQFSKLKSNQGQYIVRVGDLLDIVAATWTPTIQTPGTLDVHLRWTNQKPHENLVTYLTLKDTDGLSWAEGSSILKNDQDWLKSAQSPGNYLDGQIQLPLFASLLPGDYSLSLSISDSENQGIGLINPDGTFSGISADLGTVRIESSPRSQSEIAQPILADISFPGLHIRAVNPPPTTLFAGDTLPFRLEASLTSQPFTDAITWAVQCGDETRSQGNILDLPSNPEDWQAGHYYELRYAPLTDPKISDAVCSLVLMSGSQTPVTVGEFFIQARKRQYNLPKEPQYILKYNVGNFGQLIGVDITQPEVSMEKPLKLTLYWLARDAAQLNFTVFVHLTGSDGKVWAQSDSQPQEGIAPTITWLNGQVIVDEHSLDIKNSMPAGKYILYAGMYDADTGYRETLYMTTGERVADDRIQVGIIEVND